MALDVPSGLDADTGQPLGATFRATHTRHLHHRPGLLTNDGPDHCGEISVQRIDIDAPAWLPARGGHAVAPSLFRDQLQPRPRNTHKGIYGDAGILGGNAGMVGAALLAGRAALWLGTGRCSWACSTTEARRSISPTRVDAAPRTRCPSA